MDDKWKLSLELDDDQLFALLNALDFSSRMAAGQWDNITKVMYGNKDDNGNPMCDKWFFDDEDDKLAVRLRNQLCPWFEEHNFGANASLGIYSPHLSMTAKRQYDLYKHIMYQRNMIKNIDNVYSYTPHDAGDKHVNVHLEQLDN